MATFRFDGPPAEPDQVAAALSAVIAYMGAEEMQSAAGEPASRWVEQARLEGVSRAAAWERRHTRGD